MTPEERRENYGCDITYVTNSELGFDFLRDNLASVSLKAIDFATYENPSRVNYDGSVCLTFGTNALCGRSGIQVNYSRKITSTYCCSMSRDYSFDAA